MSYQVFLLSSLGAPRDHQAIFVETKSDQSGQVFHVTGSIQDGMTYQSRPEARPEDSVTFVGKKLLGTVATTDYGRFESVCQRIPPPAKQFHGAKRLHPHVPLRRCGEWARETVQALTDEGVLQTSTMED